MTTIELKDEIHKKVDALNNVGILMDINNSLDYFSDNLSLEESKVLNRIINFQADKAIPHHQVMKEARTWLKK